MRRGWRAATTVSVAGVVLLVGAALALAARHAAAPHRGDSVRSVSNPPSQVPKRLRLTVGTSLLTVAVYASPGRKLVKGAVRIASGARVRRHRVTVKVPGRVGPGLWFVVVCPPAGPGSCAASREPMQRIATRLSPPVQAHPAPETSTAATATIGATGGTLDATAADGTRFHLVIAANSVPDGTQITMTPVSSLGGVRSGGKFVAGVQLAPEGLVLIHGGTLTITPSHPVAIANQVGYGYDGTGDDVHRVPLLPTRPIVIPLAHFSGVGVLDGVAGALAGTGSSILDRYSALVAQELYAARLGYISVQAAFEDCQKLLVRALGELNAQEVPPGLNDDGAAQKAIRDILAVARTSALLDSSESMFESVKPTIYKLEEGIYKRAQQRCADNHDLTQISRILGTDRSEQLLGGYTGHGLSEDLKCLRFRIDFDSAIDVLAGSGGSGSWHLEYVAHPTVTPDLSQVGIMTGSTAGTYASASGTITGPDGSTGTVTSSSGDTFDVVGFDMSTDPTVTAPPTLTLDLHSPSEQYHAHDPSNPGGDFDKTDHEWLNVFNEFHNPQNGWTVLTLERVPGNGELVARGTFSNSAPDGSATESTTVDVFHTPPPA